MTAWLLDTNVISELRRPKPEPKVVAFVRGQPLEALYISAVTLAEIRFGIELLLNRSTTEVLVYPDFHRSASFIPGAFRRHLPRNSVALVGLPERSGGSDHQASTG